MKKPNKFVLYFILALLAGWLTNSIHIFNAGIITFIAMEVTQKE